MERLILYAFILTVLGVVIYTFIKYGFSFNTLEIAINEIIRLRALFFTFFWIWVCIKMMLMVDDDSKWVLLPFILCGIACLLMMYEKTRKAGYISFGVIFFGGIFLAIFIGIYNEYFSHSDMASSIAMIVMVLVFSILAGAFIYHMIKKK